MLLLFLLVRDIHTSPQNCRTPRREYSAQTIASAAGHEAGRQSVSQSVTRLGTEPHKPISTLPVDYHPLIRGIRHDIFIYRCLRTSFPIYGSSRLVILLLLLSWTVVVLILLSHVHRTNTINILSPYIPHHPTIHSPYHPPRQPLANYTYLTFHCASYPTFPSDPLPLLLLLP